MIVTIAVSAAVIDAVEFAPVAVIVVFAIVVVVVFCFVVFVPVVDGGVAVLVVELTL